MDNHHHKPVFPLPSAGELVAFPHGAAGHQGISSNAAGDLIIKPCTQAELDFYEAAKDHPDFQVHMPVYMGKLELGNAAVTEAMGAISDQGVSAPALVASGGDEAAKASSMEETKAQSEQKGGDTKAKAWMPSGGKKIDTGLAIVLENAAAAFKKPNVIDLKLGSRLWDDNAPEATRQKLDQVSANTTSGSLGFRVAGAKIWLGDSAKNSEVELNTEIKDGYKSWNKHYGQSLDKESVPVALAKFFSGVKKPAYYGGDKVLLGSEEARVLIARLIRELENIQFVLENQESRMYSASVLVVIEGDPQALQDAMNAEKESKRVAESAGKQDLVKEEEEEEAEDDDDDDESVITPKVMEVRLIDFAHAAFTPGQGSDENALRGIRSIIEILKEICK